MKHRTKFFIFALIISFFLPNPVLAQEKHEPTEAEVKQLRKILHQSAQTRQNAMESPEVKKQMEEMKKELAARGIDTSSLDRDYRAQINNNKTEDKNLAAAFELRDCMRSKLGDEGIVRATNRGMAFVDQLDKLCDAKNTAGAEKLAARYAEESKSDPDFIVMQRCFELFDKKYQDLEEYQSLRAQYQYPTPPGTNKESLCN